MQQWPQTRLLLCLIAAAGFCLAQAVHPVTGRKIAPVMGVGGASWLERPEREAEEHPQEAVKLLKIQAGAVVADIGAGSGYYTALLAREVGSSGKVYATDLQPGMLKLLSQRFESEGVKNVELIQGTERETKLPATCCDMILLVDVYHEFSEPQAMLRDIKRALRPDGRLILLEFKKEDPSIPIRAEHKMSVKDVRAELEADGFRFDRVIPDLPWQHILIFRK